MADRFDLDAIEADDALLDLLAAGGESARAAGEHDPAVQMLADLRLAVEVEDELPVETIDDPESFLARCAALNPITDPFARKVATRGLAFGVAAVAALSVSGVAAAVTGDPLSPYEKVIEKMVDAVRPQTSFPQDDLDGLPVVDRSKIVKVGKDYSAKAKAEQADSDSSAGDQRDDDVPQAMNTKGVPEELQPEGKPVVTLDQLRIPPEDKPKTQDPATDKGGIKTTPVPTDKPSTPPEPTDKPTDTPTDIPADTPTDEPTDPPPTPTDEPTDTTTTTPPPTDTTTTTPPPKVETGTDGGTTDGETTDGGTTDGGTGNGSGDNNSTKDPASGDSGSGGSGGGTAQPGAGDTPAADGTTTAPSGTGSAGDTGGADADGTTTPGADEKPAADVTQAQGAVKNAVRFVVDAAVAPVVLPTPTAEAKPTKAKAGPTAAKKAAKHSSGQVAVGSVRKTYAQGKHSSGQYAEGKHAAIDRTHGSTADKAVLQILGVVNLPTKQR